MYLKKMLVSAINDIRPQLHPKAIEAIDELLIYTNNFDRCALHFGVTEFFSKNVDVVFGVVTEKDDEELEYEKLFNRTLEQEVKDSQFATHQENVLYCGDTKNLLSLLTRFHFDKGEGYWIYAQPDAWLHVEHKATMDPTDDTAWRGKDREVKVSVRSDQYCIVFTFKERIK